MKGSIAIKIENLCKVYRLYDKPVDRMKESLSIFKRQYHKEYYALKNININIPKGEVVGIIGTNGSGKSTLLKIITGVLNPSYGAVHIQGNISALLELGAGFNPEYTGIQNIYLNGTMMNKTKEEVDAELENIIKFADIGEFIYQPVKTYSSGMFVRLAFAVATSIKPDILVVDEALSVGDINFQMKSINRIKELMEGGTTVLFVSHDIMTIKTLCQKVIYLNHGEVVAYGDSGEVCELYLNNQYKKSGIIKSKEKDQDSKSSNEETIINRQFLEAIKLREGNGKVLVSNVLVEDNDSSLCRDFYYKSLIKIKVYFEVMEDVENIVLALYLKNKNQIEVIGTNTKYEGVKFNNLKAGNKYLAEFSFINYLEEGEYGVSLLLADAIPTTIFYDIINNTQIISSHDLPGEKRWALVGIPMEVKCKDL